MSADPHNASESDAPDPYYAKKWHDYQKKIRPKRYATEDGYQRMEKTRSKLIKRYIVQIDPHEFFPQNAINRARVMAGCDGHYETFCSEEATSLRYPLRDWGEQGEFGQRGPEYLRLSKEGRELIERVIEGPLNLRKVIPILVQKCGVSDSRLAELQWPDIVEAFRVYINSNHPLGPSKKQKRKPGGQQKYDPQADAKLARDWEIARQQGSSKDEFARAKGLLQKDFDKLLNRVRKRKTKKS